jgi:hypothetical protein
MEMYGGLDVGIHVFLSSALVWSKWSVSPLAALPPGERAPGIHWIGGWVNLRIGLDDMEKLKFLTLLGLELRPLGSPVAIPTTLPRLIKVQPFLITGCGNLLDCEIMISHCLDNRLTDGDEVLSPYAGRALFHRNIFSASRTPFC